MLERMETLLTPFASLASLFVASFLAATLIPLSSEAALFADSRYWVQAEAELAGSGIALEKIQTGAATNHLEWITSHLKPGQTLGVDGQVLGLAAAQQLRATCERAGLTLRTGGDPLAAAWLGKTRLIDNMAV